MCARGIVVYTDIIPLWRSSHETTNQLLASQCTSEKCTSSRLQKPSERDCVASRCICQNTHPELNHKEMLRPTQGEGHLGNRLPFIFNNVKNIKLKEKQNLSQMTKKT